MTDGAEPVDPLDHEAVAWAAEALRRIQMSADAEGGLGVETGGAADAVGRVLSSVEPAPGESSLASYPRATRSERRARTAARDLGDLGSPLDEARAANVQIESVVEAAAEGDAEKTGDAAVSVAARLKRTQWALYQGAGSDE